VAAFFIRKGAKAMSEYIRNNPVMRSIEERHKQDEEVALRAEDLKLIKPLVGTLKDEMELEVALQQIIYNLCDNVKSYNREMRSCVAKLRESGPGYFFILTKENAVWVSSPSNVVAPNTDAFSVWSYYKFSSDVNAYLMLVTDTEKMEGNIRRLDYPRCMEVLSN
jgi:hypothetical protein